MEKPDWKDAPPWANFLARDNIDYGGGWRWHELQPVPVEHCWRSEGRIQNAVVRTHWADTLETRPCSQR